MKVAIITNIPSHYRNPVFSILSKLENITSVVLYCSPSEPNREWKAMPLDFPHQFLSQKQNTFKHFNWNIFSQLNQFKPDVVITSGFVPTMLLAWLWTVLHRKKHIPFSDANLTSEKHLSIFHKWVRKIIYACSHAFLGASDKTRALFESYHIQSNKIFKSCLAINNEAFQPTASTEKKYDLMFCGQFIDGKLPLFFCQIAIELAQKYPNTKILLVGNGVLKERCLNLLTEHKVDFYDAGFVQPEELPAFYQKSKLFIFPTKRDAWGLVANEALASGVPVLTTSEAGVSHELVINDYNGFVFDNTELKAWVDKIELLLNDKSTYNSFSENAQKSVEAYTHTKAAKGILNAIKFVLK